MNEAAPPIEGDGTTVGDRWEALSLITSGALLWAFPVMALLDRAAEPWRTLSVAVGALGLGIAWLGGRWFLLDRPRWTVAEPPPSLVSAEGPELPLALRLSDGGTRTAAHLARAICVAGALLLLLFELPSLGAWALALFVASFAADAVLLRPRRHRIDDDGMRPDAMIGGATLRWSEVERLCWRLSAPGIGTRQPGGERIVFVRRDAPTVEFVFVGARDGDRAEDLVRAVLPVLGAARVTCLSAESKPPPQSGLEPPGPQAPIGGAVEESRADSSVAPAPGPSGEPQGSS